MIMRLKKWKCEKCKVEYWSVYKQHYLICPECEAPCNIIENTWKINEELWDY